ncbi:MAG: hypothetical protein ABIJ59_14220 [Pseudomonadota bacterium]
MVEALRYAFGYNETLSELDKPLENSIRDLQQANLKDSKITIIYRTAHSENRVLQATYDPKADYSTKVYTDTGDFLDVPNVENSGDYPLRLYGWSEIETIGREPSRQRDLLDRLIPELLPILKRRTNIRKELKTNRAVINHCIADVNAAFSASDGSIRRFTEYKSDYDKLNTEDVKTIFSVLDFANGKKSILKLLIENAVSAIDKLKGSYSITLKTDLDTILETANQELKDWWHAIESKRLDLSATEQDVQKILKQAVENIESFIKLCSGHIEEIDTAITALEHELREKFSRNDSMQKIADLRANANKRLKFVNNLRLNYQKKWSELIDAFKQRKEITTSLEQVQNEIAGVRSKKNSLTEQTLNQFLPKDMKVTIDFHAGKDTAKFSSILYSIFGAKSNQAKKVSKIIETHTTPVSFASMMGKKDFKELLGKNIGTDTETLIFDDKDISFCVDKTTPYDKDSSADTAILIENGKRLEMILNVQETEWDDRETILLNGGPVNDKSPGQRSSAMLPLIALAEETPLVIDQPEDNLDKRVISQVLMQVLAKLKEHRQIIVCTHDPNILVGGDAEQVVVLEAESDKKGKVGMHGSIDNDDIVQTVINVLEGGAEAFEARKKRYRERTHSNKLGLEEYFL